MIFCASTGGRSLSVPFSKIASRPGDHLELPFESQSKYVKKGPTRGVAVHLDALTKLTDETVAGFGLYDP
jgi:hypothetical protein